MKLRLAYGWALSLIGVWIAVAVAGHQPLWAAQPGALLRRFGAVDGAHFTVADTWCLIASQWLHVKFAHMLLNAAVVAAVGQAAERRAGLSGLAVGLIGGTLGQAAILWLDPHAPISGASQASFALCGFVLTQMRLKSFGWWAAVAGLASGLALDLFVSDQGGLTPGHLAGLLFGLTAGVVARARKTAN